MSSLSKKAQALLLELEIDLKDPLTAIRFVAAEVRETRGEDPELQTYMDIIARETQRILRIMRQVQHRKN